MKNRRLLNRILKGVYKPDTMCQLAVDGVYHYIMVDSCAIYRIKALENPFSTDKAFKLIKLNRISGFLKKEEPVALTGGEITYTTADKKTWTRFDDKDGHPILVNAEYVKCLPKEYQQSMYRNGRLVVSIDDKSNIVAVIAPLRDKSTQIIIGNKKPLSPPAK
jgi:hypothetical protein